MAMSKPMLGLLLGGTLGISAGTAIAALFSLLLFLKAGTGLFWDIALPGMLLGLIVGFATQKFGRPAGSAAAR